MSNPKWIALRSIWHKTDDRGREVLSLWCHCLWRTGNLILPHFDLQMKLSGLSESQSTIFDLLTMSILKWVKKKIWPCLVKLGECQKMTYFFAIETKLLWVFRVSHKILWKNVCQSQNTMQPIFLCYTLTPNEVLLVPPVVLVIIYETSSL